MDRLVAGDTDNHGNTRVPTGLHHLVMEAPLQCHIKILECTISIRLMEVTSHLLDQEEICTGALRHLNRNVLKWTFLICPRVEPWRGP